MLLCSCCIDAKLVVHCMSHLIHVIMISEFLGPVWFPFQTNAFFIRESFPDFLGLVEGACGNCMLGTCVNHFLGKMRTWALAAKDWKFSYFKCRWPMVCWYPLVGQRGACFVNHGVSDECTLIKDVEDNVTKSALVVSFTGVPKFGDGVIWDGINELISKDGLHGNGSVISFLGAFVCCL